MNLSRRKSVSELDLLYPMEYEWVDGETFRPDLEGRTIPIPPKWVRDRVNLPFPNATLSAAVEDFYDQKAREILVSYIKDWPSVLQYGKHLVIAGGGNYKARTWAASAVMNEIIMRYGATQDISAGWIGNASLAYLMDARGRKDESYHLIKNKVLRTRLLLVEDPSRNSMDQDVRFFLNALYEYRDDKKLPTITTLPVTVQDDFKKMKAAMGVYLTELLSTNVDYIVNL